MDHKTTRVSPGCPPTYVRSSVIIGDRPGLYADRYVINWWSGERKVYGVLHVTHFSYLGPVLDCKNSSISPSDEGR